MCVCIVSLIRIWFNKYNESVTPNSRRKAAPIDFVGF